jgi:hypothetical protein
MKCIAISCLLLAMSTLVPTAARAQAAPADRWQPVRFLLGSWQGEARGEPGKGSVERRYQWVLGEKFIEEHNTSRYEPKAAGKEPEVHEHRSFISYDKARKTLMLRQFHEESFVILYAMNLELSTATRVVFDSVNFENFSNEWKARETYDVKSDEEFVETFALAAPGKEFEVYSHNHFRRRKE